LTDNIDEALEPSAAGEPSAERAAPAPPVSLAQALASATASGLIFALFGFLFSLRAFADAVLPHVLVPANSLVFREIADGRPVSRLLDWHNSAVPLLADVRDMHPAFTIGIGILLFLVLGLLGISIVNPTFRPISRSSRTPNIKVSTGSPPSPLDSLKLRAETLFHIDNVHLEQAVRLACLCALPVLVVWVVTGGFGTQALVLAGFGDAAILRRELVRYMALGVGIFVTFSPLGVAGSFGILSRAYAADDRAAPGRQGVNLPNLARIATVGAVFGAALAAIERQTLGVPSGPLFLIFHRLGTFNTLHLNAIGHPFFLSILLSWFAVGMLLYAFARPGLPIVHRILILGLPAVSLVLLPAIRKPLAADQLVKRFDALPLAAAPQEDPQRPMPLSPAGKEAGAALAKLAGLETIDQTKPHTRDVVVFHPGGGFQVEMTDVTDDGIIADPGRAARVLDFLKMRNYQSALSWSAIKTLFNAANVQFDTTSAIRAGLTDAEYTPHMANIGDTVRNLLSVCAATPQNLALLREYADEKRFVIDNRNSCKLLGTLFRRFGDVDEAEKWYRRADMPETFMQRFHAEKPLFHTGKVVGRLLFNGVPLSGMQVGVAPRRLNGLPRDMEPQLLGYDRELISADPDISPYYSLYHPRPFHFRWIVGGTTTGADGRFEIQSLTEGEYYLVCALPGNVKLELPLDKDLRVQNAPHAFTVSYSSPTFDAGAIGFTKPGQPLSGSTSHSP
jgi:hypothetical protein